MTTVTDQYVGVGGATWDFVDGDDSFVGVVYDEWYTDEFTFYLCDGEGFELSESGFGSFGEARVAMFDAVGV